MQSVPDCAQCCRVSILKSKRNVESVLVTYEILVCRFRMSGMECQVYFCCG
jgi:hypothetical protein